MLQFGKCLFEGVVLVETCFSGTVTVLRGEEFRQWAVDIVADNFFVGDENVFEDGLIELASDLVACSHIERMGVPGLLIWYLFYLLDPRSK